MLSPMKPLPTRPDDPRIDGWYHTIELAPGIVTTRAAYDHRPIVDRVGLPKSLAGKSALDVGTADGFWAFEMESRGADRVVAIDIARVSESDVTPVRKPHLPADWHTAGNYCAERFATAHAMRRSRVEYRTCSVYNLSPDSVGRFDVVYCGSLLVHLFNPLQALCNIRTVTKEMAIIETVSFHPGEPPESSLAGLPYVWFGSLEAEGDEPGRYCMYWRISQKALCDMLLYAGFRATEPRGLFRMTGPGGGDVPVTAVVARV
jgi:hypothetical protein